MTQTQLADATPTRTRSYSWQDATAAWRAARGLSGLETLRRMADGELPPPPLAETLSFSAVTVGEGCFAVRLVPAEFHYNPLGTVHGGVLAALLDTAAGCAVQTTLPADTGYTSADLHTRFLAPVRVETGELHCEGSVLHRGTRTATAMARLEDGGGRLLAHATSTCLLLPAARPPS